MVMIKRMIVDQHHPSRRYRVGFPLLGSLEELEIGLNVFNELDDADFSRYSSPTGEKYRSSSSETGRPAATPLRRGRTQPHDNKYCSLTCKPVRIHHRSCSLRDVAVDGAHVPTEFQQAGAADRSTGICVERWRIRRVYPGQFWLEWGRSYSSRCRFQFALFSSRSRRAFCAAHGRE